DPTATTRFRKTLFAFYLQRLRQDEQRADALRRNFEAWRVSKAERGKRVTPGIRIPNRRLSFKISARTDDDVRWVMAASG
ncbi:hypothetical protein SB781_39460, partial [Paraburkholderia sp. SIMBA_061]